MTEFIDQQFILQLTDLSGCKCAGLICVHNFVKADAIWVKASMENGPSLFPTITFALEQIIFL